MNVILLNENSALTNFDIWLHSECFGNQYHALIEIISVARSPQDEDVHIDHQSNKISTNRVRHVDIRVRLPF